VAADEGRVEFRLAATDDDARGARLPGHHLGETAGVRVARVSRRQAEVAREQRMAARILQFQREGAGANAVAAARGQHHPVEGLRQGHGRAVHVAAGEEILLRRGARIARPQQIPGQGGARFGPGGPDASRSRARGTDLGVERVEGEVGEPLRIGVAHQVIVGCRVDVDGRSRVRQVHAVLADEAAEVGIAGLGVALA